MKVEKRDSALPAAEFPDVVFLHFADGSTKELSGFRIVIVNWEAAADTEREFLEAIHKRERDRNSSRADKGTFEVVSAK